MSNQAKKFNTKMLFIYEKISNNSLDEFTKLFWIQSKTTFENRRYNLNKNWLKNATVSKNFHKEYENYPFRLLTFHGQSIFRDVQEFLEIEIQEFKERIQNYVEYKNRPIIPRNLSFKYLYTFSCNGLESNNNIDYYHIKHLTGSSETIDIEVTPPKNKKSLNIDSYKGTLKLHENKLIISFSNSKDYISAIFNLELINRHTKHVVGVVIGIADFNEKIPVAKKVILTKRAVEDINELYLLLNETEIISAKENAYKFRHNDKNFIPSHLEKYINKIDGLNKLFEKLQKDGYFGSFYEKLALKELLSTSVLMQKFQKKHSFYVHYRKRLLDILIESYKTAPYQKISMVIPIYKDDNLFEQQSDKAITLQKKLQSLSKNVIIEIIFVITQCEKIFKEEFFDLLREMDSSMSIKFAFRKKIVYEVNSIDFFFTDRDDFVISKQLRTNITYFQLYKHKNTIDEYHGYFRKIRKRSISYKDFMQDKNKICQEKNLILETLSGEWYHYLYGTKKFWEDKIIIYEDSRVEYFCEGNKTEKGRIINKEYQSIILLDDTITKRLFSIIFDHQPYQIQKAFFTKNIAKQLKKELDIFVIGILSRKPIPIEKAKEILGNVDDVRFLEKNDMIEKLSEYLIENYGYQNTQN
jgi:hypothetical protein